MGFNEDIVAFAIANCLRMLVIIGAYYQFHKSFNIERKMNIILNNRKNIKSRSLLTKQIRLCDIQGCQRKNIKSTDFSPYVYELNL